MCRQGSRLQQCFKLTWWQSVLKSSSCNKDQRQENNHYFITEMYECMPEIKTSMLGLSFSFLCPFNHSLKCIQKSSLWILEWLNARIVSFPNELRSHTALLNMAELTGSAFCPIWKGSEKDWPIRYHLLHTL